MSVGYGYIDAHCHLADPAIAATRAEMVREARGRGVSRFVQGGVDPEDWDRQEALADALAAEAPGAIGFCFGVHPWVVMGAGEEICDRALAALPERLRRWPGAAVGEIGLDLAHPERGDPRAGLQERVFKQQLEIASGLGRPVVLHVVKAHARALELLREHVARGGRIAGGLVHAYSGSFETARAYLGLGLVVSVGGGILKPGYETLKKAVRRLGPGELVLESESPGQAHDPRRLFEVAEAVGRIKEVAPEDVLRQSRDTLMRIFGAPTDAEAT